MDILDPEVVWVEGKSYRFYESNCWGFKREIEEPYVEDCFDEPEALMDLLDNHDDDFIIKSCGEGKFKHSFSLLEEFYRFIVGPKGMVKKNLEVETQTKIQVPHAKNQPANSRNKIIDEEIHIVGSSRENILSCRRRIDLMVESCKKKVRPNHFVSIPLNNNMKIVKNYNEFKKKVLDDPDAKKMGIMEEFFVSDSKLHLTIGVMLLINEKERKEAVCCLEKCVEEIVKPLLSNKKGPLVFKVQGVDIFHDRRNDVKKSKVLFGKVYPNQLLQDIANKIYLYLFEKGIVRESTGSKNVQLHMTLMKNSRLLDTKDISFDNLPRFDATKLLQDYKNYEFGEAVLETLLICEMNSAEENEPYKNLVEIDLLK